MPAAECRHSMCFDIVVTAFSTCLFLDRSKGVSNDDCFNCLYKKLLCLLNKIYDSYSVLFSFTQQLIS